MRGAQLINWFNALESGTQVAIVTGLFGVIASLMVGAGWLIRHYISVTSARIELVIRTEPSLVSEKWSVVLTVMNTGGKGTTVHTVGVEEVRKGQPNLEKTFSISPEVIEPHGKPFILRVVEYTDWKWRNGRCRFVVFTTHRKKPYKVWVPQDH